ncbi:MAG TPA: flagellar M-ring protein FliF [Rhodospirillaceae bacterium]|nr:MAG: flagellar M-ring protein FliF [Alphaproteobacteria bacterium GWF2_58_20]HAU29101.1 flagellar M-ring protein FliF [Rhodospirillaceae bacterium]
MDDFLRTLRNLGTPRLALMSGVSIALIAFFMFLSTRLSTGSMGILYSDLATSDAGAISAELDKLQTPYTVSSDGTQISVPSADIGRIRMALAQEGLPSGGSVGYEIFDRQQTFGASTFLQKINQVRALEGELARTVSTLSPVRQARIHIVLPEKEMWSTQKQPATASVFVQIRGGGRLEGEHIRSIQHLIAAAVPGLKPGSVSVIDNQGTLLARGDAESTASSDAENSDELRLRLERRMTTTLEDLVAKTVGYGNVRANVSLDMDFDRISTNSETYDPDTQVVRSTQSVTEDASTLGDSAGGAVSVSNSLPDNTKTAPAGAEASGSRNSRTEETINYEIAKTITNHVRESGQVKRMSVAVLVDGIYSEDEKGNMTYQPRSKEDLETITALVRSAAGYDEARGDQVEVVNMQFTKEEERFDGGNDGTILGFPRSDLLNLAETIVVGILGILIVLLVVRPILGQLLHASAQASQDSSNAQGMLTDQSRQMAALPSPGGGSSMQVATEDSEFENMIDIDKVEGRVRASSLRKLGEIVEKHPVEAVSILRSWVSQENS